MAWRGRIVKDVRGVSMDIAAGWSHSSQGKVGDIQRMTQEPPKPFRRAGQRRVTASRDAVDGAHHLPGTALTPWRADPAARFHALRLMLPGVRRHVLGGAPLVDLFRDDPASRAFDLLRTRLLQTLRANGWNRIAIVAPTRGCGATFTAVNLAQSLARVAGSRTILMDLNQRDPGVAAALEMAPGGDLRGFLSGELAMERHLVRINDTLALGLTGETDRDAAELLHDARSAATLADMNEALQPDTILYDLPAMLEHDDLAAFLPQVDGVLLVADGTRTLARDIAACEKTLDGQTRLLGVVLNRARGSVGKGRRRGA